MESPLQWDATAWGLILGVVGAASAPGSVVALFRTRRIERRMVERLASARLLAALVALEHGARAVLAAESPTSFAVATGEWRAATADVHALLGGVTGDDIVRLREVLKLSSTMMVDSLAVAGAQPSMAAATARLRRKLHDCEGQVRSLRVSIESGRRTL